MSIYSSYMNVNITQSYFGNWKNLQSLNRLVQIPQFHDFYTHDEHARKASIINISVINGIHAMELNLFFISFRCCRAVGGLQ